MLMNYNKNGELGEIIEIKTHRAVNYSGYDCRLQRWSAAVGDAMEVLI